ncbi:MAG TPA: DinB family protein [Thermoanaerobaculia bacterium]|nr:DinB family protein [Thermoanaerobaculia bacterium]HQR68247.1 DinB family protein [Thermoanaerobaculia bacterium]
MSAKEPSGEIGLLLHLLDEAFDRTAWHGPNLFGSVRRLGAGEAAARPGAGRHSVQEIVLHCAYWKYAVRRKLTGGKRGSFPLTGSNWFAREGGAARAAWPADRALLRREHEALRAAVAAFPARKLRSRAPASRNSYLRLIAGAAAHDLYHAGQVRLIRRLVSG